MKSVYSILFFLIQAKLVLAECPQVKINFKELETFSNSLNPIILIADTQNIAQFCQVNGLRDLKESNIALDGDGWGNSFLAVKDSREKNFLQFFATSKDLDYSSKTVKQKVYQAALNSIEKNTGALSKENKVLYLEGIQNREKLDMQQDSAINVGLAQSLFLCKDLTITNAVACAKGIKKSIEIAHPVNGVTTLPLWKEAVTDPIYMKVFKKVSIKIISNLKAGIAPSSRLMDDLKLEFFTATGDKAKSDNYAWKTMAILAGGGGNANKRPTLLIGTEVKNELSDLLWVLSNGSMALDRLSAEKGFLYTFPKEVNNLCDYGKNYHFWMTAYLARELGKIDNNKAGAAAAAYTIQKGYQFAKVGNGRDPTKPFNQPLYSNYNNNIRLDLSLAAAGAWYGVTYEKNKNQLFSQTDIDDGIKKTFEDAKPLSRTRDVLESDFIDGSALKTIGLYKDWKKVINPDRVFKIFEQKSGN